MSLSAYSVTKDIQNAIHSFSFASISNDFVIALTKTTPQHFTSRQHKYFQHIATQNTNSTKKSFATNYPKAPGLETFTFSIRCAIPSLLTQTLVSSSPSWGNLPSVLKALRQHNSMTISSLPRVLASALKLQENTSVLKRLPAAACHAGITQENMTEVVTNGQIYTCVSNSSLLSSQWPQTAMEAQVPLTNQRVNQLLRTPAGHVSLLSLLEPGRQSATVHVALGGVRKWLAFSENERVIM